MKFANLSSKMQRALAHYARQRASGRNGDLTAYLVPTSTFGPTDSALLKRGLIERVPQRLGYVLSDAGERIYLTGQA